MPSVTKGDVRPTELTNPDRMVIRLADACAEAGISPSTMRRLRLAGCGPRLIRLSERCLGVRRVDLADWLKSRSSAD